MKQGILLILAIFLFVLTQQQRRNLKSQKSQKVQKGLNTMVKNQKSLKTQKMRKSKKSQKSQKKQIITYAAGDPVPVTTIYKRPERMDIHFPTYSVTQTYTPIGHTHIVGGSSVLPNSYGSTYIYRKKLMKNK